MTAPSNELWKFAALRWRSWYIRPFLRPCGTYGVLTSTLLFLVAIFARRGEQLLTPQVWDEEGYIIQRVLESGFAAVFEPMNGYLVVLPSMIIYLAANVSITGLPLIGTVLTWAITAGVLIHVARAPIDLHGGIGLGLFAVMVPTDPEVVGIPLYTFWWATLLLFVIGLTEPDRLRWRDIPILLLAGFSTPVVVLLPPLLIARIAYVRTTRSLPWTVAGLAILISAVQVAISASDQMIGIATPINISLFVKLIQKFLGGYLIGNLTNSSLATGIAGMVVLSTLAIGMRRCRHEPSVWVAGYLIGGSIALGILRTPLDILHPVHAGPRYFFLPFVLLSWLLFHFFLQPIRSRCRILFAMVLGLSLINTLPVLWRSHDDLDWPRHVRSAKNFDRYVIPIHFAGSRCSVWDIEVGGTAIAEFLSRDLLITSDGRPPLPFVVLREKQLAATTPVPPLVSTRSVEITTEGKASMAILRDGPVVFCGPTPVHSFPQGYENWTGRVSFEMRQGQSVLYRAGNSADVAVAVQVNNQVQTFDAPCELGCAAIVFSSRTLPEQFRVHFIDSGIGPSDWFAVGAMHEE